MRTSGRCDAHPAVCEHASQQSAKCTSLKAFSSAYIVEHGARYCARYQLDWETDERDILIPHSENAGKLWLNRLLLCLHATCYATLLCRCYACPKCCSRHQCPVQHQAASATVCPYSCRGPGQRAADRAQLPAQIPFPSLPGSEDADPHRRPQGAHLLSCAAICCAA